MATIKRINRHVFDGYDDQSKAQSVEIGRFVEFEIEGLNPDGWFELRVDGAGGLIFESPRPANGGNRSLVVWGATAGECSLVVIVEQNSAPAASQSFIVKDEPIAAFSGGAAAVVPSGAQGGASNTKTVNPPPMLILRFEEEKVEEQAMEKAFGFAYTRAIVGVNSSGGELHTFSMRPDADGIVRIPMQSADLTGIFQKAYLMGGKRSRKNVRWSTDKEYTTVTTAEALVVKIAARLRFSVMSIIPTFIKSGTATEIDTTLVDKLAQANCDDFWLVATIRPVNNDWTKVEWAKSFKPGGSAGREAEYLSNLATELGSRKIRLIIGYALVNLSSKPTDPDPVKQKKLQDEHDAFIAYLRGWCDWLMTASNDALDAHAKNIVKFFDDQKIHIDGVGFDLELDPMKVEHRSKVAALFQSVSAALADRNGIVGYANAPSQYDGADKNLHGFMNAQPYALCNAAPNILSWPMCYDAVKAIPMPQIKSSIAVALKQDTSTGGGGVHPSQLQFALWCPKLGVSETEKWCRELLRPNKIGLTVYTMPKGNEISGFLDNCKKWEAALNPPVVGGPREGQPLGIPEPERPIVPAS